MLGTSCWKAPVNKLLSQFRDESRGATGGIIELDGDRATAFVAARAEITRLCDEKSYTIVREGEEATGGATTWRVYFECEAP